MRLRVIERGQWSVLAACRDRGDCPLLDFLNQLPPNLEKDARKTARLLERVSDHGPPRKTTISHQISGPIWEFIRGRIRLLWFYDEGKTIILSQAFVKKSQKTPRSEIDRALAAYGRYQKAKARGDLEIKE